MTTRGRLLAATTMSLIIGVLAWLLFVTLPRKVAITADAARSSPASAHAPLAERRKIKARLFYVSEDGARLVSVEQDVSFGEGTVEQAKAIVEAQLAPAVPPAVSAIPAGTTLRALFVAPTGEAYVDFGPELVTAHPGGSTNELLTVHTIVEVLTANLPGISAVQILVNGKEVETLAGHVDLRRPFLRDTSRVE